MSVDAHSVITSEGLWLVSYDGWSYGAVPMCDEALRQKPSVMTGILRRILWKACPQ